MDIFDKLFLPMSLLDYFKKEIKSVNLEQDIHKLLLRFLLISLILSTVTVLLFRKFPDYGSNFKLILDATSSIFIAFFITFSIILFLFYVWLTIKKYNRKNEIEEVLADYLQLVSTNVGSGMTIDQALWYAVRKRFGVLSDEIEIVAKKIMSGVEVKEALSDFTEKYDSDILKKSIILLIEGMESGGKLSELIAKIAWNIKETQMMKKQLAADTTAYVMFIGFASLIAAPVLFALSHRILIIMSDVISKIDLSSAVGVSTKIPITSLGTGLSQSDFKVFAYLSLFIISIFSSLIIGSVRTGDVKGGVRLIPIFIVISFILFLVASIVLSKFFSGVGL